MKVRISKDVIDGWEDRVALKEKSDCTVRSLATALAIPYKAAHKMAEVYGRKSKQGMTACNWYVLLGDLVKEGVLRRLDENETKTYYKSTDRYRKMRLSTFTEKHNRGRYIVDVRGHAGSVINGEVIEAGKYVPDQYVMGAWEVRAR